MPALIAGRIPALNKSASKKICPSVMEISIGRYECGNVAGLSLNNRQSRQRTGLSFDCALGECFHVIGIHARCALQQTGMQIKHIAGISFTAGRTAQQ